MPSEVIQPALHPFLVTELAPFVLFRCSKKAKVDDKFFSFQDYSDDVFNRLVVVAAEMLGAYPSSVQLLLKVLNIHKKIF